MLGVVIQPSSITYYQFPVIHDSHFPFRNFTGYLGHRHAVHRKALTLRRERDKRGFLPYLDAKVQEVVHLFPVGGANR